MDSDTAFSDIHVRFPTVTLKSIDELLGQRKRNTFILTSTEKELQKLRMLRGLERSFGAWAKEKHHELKRGSIAYQRKLRKESESRFNKKVGA